MRNDDLARFADEPIVQALQAPGTVAELDGIDPVLAEYRAHASSRRRRLAGRIGTGASIVAVTVAMTGGVAAAAYTQSLPAPLQSALHSAFGAIGVPEPPLSMSKASTASSSVNNHRASTSRAGRSKATTITATPMRTPSPAGNAASTQPAATQPSAPPASAAASPTAEAAPAPAALTGQPVRSGVTAGQRDAVHGTLTTADGSPVAGHVVYLSVVQAGSQQWRRVASGRTADDGTVTLRTPQLDRNVKVRLVTAQGLRSQPAAVTVAPKVSITTSRTSDGRHVVVHVSVTGAETGDTVDLARHASSGWSRVAHKTLPEGASVTFTVPVGTTTVHYRVRVVATSLHGVGDGWFAVSP